MYYYYYDSGIGYQPDKIPSDHVVSVLESLTTVCHYCLLDNAQQDISIGQPLPAHTNNIVNDTANTGQIFSNLMHVFSPYGTNRVSYVRLSVVVFFQRDNDIMIFRIHLLLYTCIIFFTRSPVQLKKRRLSIQY